MKPSTALKLLLAHATLAVVLAAQTPAGSLAERWTALRAKDAKVHTREAAKQLGVSEAELLATTVGKTATRLRDGKDVAKEILTRVPELGEITAITRNDDVVIEKTAVSEKPRFGESGDGGFVGGPIDLRIALKNWRFAFAVTQPGREGKISRSLQFFNAQGVAVHKIYVKSDAGIPVFEKIVADFAHAEPASVLATEPAAAQPADKADAEIDREALLKGWRELTNVHQFSGVVKKIGAGREQALRLATPEFTEQVTPAAVRVLLETAAAKGVAIMAFVANDGMTQIFTGKIHKVAPSSEGEWFNVLDPDFNLHLRQASVARVWIVKKPTKDGTLTDVEVFDAHGKLIVQFYSSRERGQPESAEWHALLAGLPRS